MEFVALLKCFSVTPFYKKNLKHLRIIDTQAALQVSLSNTDDSLSSNFQHMCVHVYV